MSDTKLIERIEAIEAKQAEQDARIETIGTTLEAHNDIDRMIRRIVADLEGVGV